MSEKTKLGTVGKSHVKEMMNRFTKGKLLRSSDGTKLNPHKPEDVSRALAIAYEEARAGERRGFVRREWRNSIRMRPRKAGK